MRFDNFRRDVGVLAYPPVLTSDQANDITMARFVLRTSVPPQSLLEAVRRTLAELRPRYPSGFRRDDG
ncbi:MAG TPA: hypothetical protein VLK65_15655 [Vicinamibacteria bacterium]|nr:hypothetical protein [Vicinamibacteria bacterium]